MLQDPGGLLNLRFILWRRGDLTESLAFVLDLGSFRSRLPFILGAEVANVTFDTFQLSQTDQSRLPGLRG